MAQKLAPAEKIAQIYLQHLQLFASLYPIFICIFNESVCVLSEQNGTSRFIIIRATAGPVKPLALLIYGVFAENKELILIHGNGYKYVLRQNCPNHPCPVWFLGPFGYLGCDTPSWTQLDNHSHNHS